MMVITHLRAYQADKTTGRIMVEGMVLGQTLEDIGRPSGIKIPAETCIPEGVYRVAITLSARFKRPMILLYTNPKDFTCDYENIKFSGIRVHSGHKTQHTEGCVLITDSISLQNLENIIGKALNNREPVTWTITRDQQ
jgi:hypothetical protein